MLMLFCQGASCRYGKSISLAGNNLCVYIRIVTKALGSFLSFTSYYEEDN